MKKLIFLPLLICLCLSFTACTKKFDTFESYGTYEGVKYPRFLSTDWGMTEAEALKALGVKDEDSAREAEGVRNVASWSGRTVNLTFDGEPITAYLIFENASDDGTYLDLGLTEAFFVMPTASVRDKWEAAIKIPELYETSLYTICEKKGYLEEMPSSYKTKWYANPTDPTEKITTYSSQEEWNEAWKDNADDLQIASSQNQLDWHDEGGNPTMEFGYCTFYGANLAKLRYLDKTL